MKHFTLAKFCVMPKTLWKSVGNSHLPCAGVGACAQAPIWLWMCVCVTNNSKQCSENWLECVCEKWFRLLFTSNYWHDICIVVNASIVRMTFNFCYVYAYAVARAHNTVLYIYMLLMLVTEEINTRNLFERHNYAHSLKCWRRPCWPCADGAGAWAGGGLIFEFD